MIWYRGFWILAFNGGDSWAVCDTQKGVRGSFYQKLTEAKKHVDELKTEQNND